MKRLSVSDSELVEMYQRGDGLRRIAARYNVSHVTIANRLHSCGIELRPFRSYFYAAQKATELCHAIDHDGECNRPAIVGGSFCKKHQIRVQRHGDPTIVEKRGRKSK